MKFAGFFFFFFKLQLYAGHVVIACYCIRLYKTVQCQGVNLDSFIARNTRRKH